MTIQLSCTCGKKLSVKSEFAGRRVKCPACQALLQVPKPKAEEESFGDEWDLGDSAEEDFDDEPSATRAKSRGGKSSSARGATSRRTSMKDKGKKSKQSNRGLLIGLSVGGGLLVIACLAWMLWPAKPAENVAVAPADNNVGNPATANGSVADTVATTGGASAKPEIAPGSPTVNATKHEGDLNLLQGTWQPSDVVIDADQPPPANMLAEMELITWTFKGDIVSLSTPNGVVASSVKLDSSTSPKTLDMTRLDGHEVGKVGLAIYSIDGDTLKLCVTNSGTVRPKEMKPDKTLGQMVLTLKKGTLPTSGTPTTAATGAQFDHKAWQQASGKLKAMKVLSILHSREPNDSSFPDGLKHYAVIDPPATADGSISAELWAVITSVSHVAIRTMSINDATVQQLSKHPGLVGLNISGRSAVTTVGISELKKCPNLRSLHLSGVPVSLEFLNAITQLGELRAFGINDAPVSTEMVAVISQLSKLQSLSLQNAGTTDDDTAQIVKLTNLKSLLLDKSKVTDKGMQSLKSLTALTMLSVRGVGISPPTLADFEAAVPNCKVFK